MKKLIPFSWYPAHWGLQGKAKEMALANFELEGIALLRKKIDINVNERTAKEQKLGHLDLDHRQKKITDYGYAKAVIKLNINKLTKEQVKIDLLELKSVHNKITDNELSKERANVLGEPWVIVKTLETDPDNPRYGRVELDWNDIFINALEEHGYGPNPDPEDTVNDWYNELCRNIALEVYAGIGDFEEQVGAAEPAEPVRTNIHADAIVKSKPKVEKKKVPPTPTIITKEDGTDDE